MKLVSERAPMIELGEFVELYAEISVGLASNTIQLAIVIIRSNSDPTQGRDEQRWNK